MDLFSQQRQAAFDRVQPLPVRLRPRTLDEFVGQDHFIGPGKLLRRMLIADRLSSAIFYGPPGTGKTTLAHIIANHTQAAFEEVNAAAVGVKEIREILARAKERLANNGQRTVLFLDEIHRFNRAQQDVLLNDVENGLILLVGATTENPFFSVNSPLISRSQIFQFEPLSVEQIEGLLDQAVTDLERGLGQYDITLTPDARRHLSITSDGDARRALLALEVAVLSQLETVQSKTKKEHPPITVDLPVAEESIQRKAITYDGTGDEHYDAASALIKSMRGSDPDATVYWLARMLEAGEDPRFLARRIAICAAEDVGNADPTALVLANAAAQITMLVGMPECQLPLSQAAIYIATAPKSNASALAIWSAGKDAREGRTLPVPRHLRDTHYRGASKLGHGEGYKYAHDYQGGYIEQSYLGVDKIYYEPTDRGHESTIKKYLSMIGRPGSTPAGSMETGERPAEPDPPGHPGEGAVESP